LNPQLAEAAGKLNPGQTSDVIEFARRVFISSRWKDKQSAHTKPLTEVRDEIEKKLCRVSNARCSPNNGSSGCGRKTFRGGIF